MTDLRASSIAFAKVLPHLESLMCVPLMAALSLPLQPHANSYKTGQYTIASPRYLILIPIATGQKSASRVKRLITENSSPSVNSNNLKRAILRYQNMLDPDTSYPSRVHFWPNQRLIHTSPGRYRPQPTRQEALNAREEALRNTKRLLPLPSGITYESKANLAHTS